MENELPRTERAGFFEPLDPKTHIYPDRVSLLVCQVKGGVHE